MLEALKGVARSIKSGDSSTETALARVSAIMMEDGLRQVVGRSFSPSETASPNLGQLIKTVLEAIERAGIAVEENTPKARLLIEVGDILYIQGNWDEAIARFEEALRISEQVGFEEGQANALRHLGRIKRRRGDWAGAQDTLERALSLYERLKHPPGEAEVLLNLGNIQFEQGNYEEAETNFQKALIVCEQVESHQLIGDITLSLGVLRHVLGHDDEAITHFTESLANFEVEGDQRRIAQACHNLGIAYAAQGLWDRAGIMYERALDTARQNSEWGMVGMVYLCRGEMQANLSDAAMAMGYAQKALEIFERLKDPLGQADTYKLFGRIAGLKTAWELAEELLNESRRLQQQHGSRLGEAEVEETRGWIYERQHNYHQAMEAYQRAMMMYHDLKAMGGARRVRDAILHLQEISGSP
jgi:tetratricopeptide (TPR) repeat protein